MVTSSDKVRSERPQALHIGWWRNGYHDYVSTAGHTKRQVPMSHMRRDTSSVLLRVAVLVLTLSTAYIHLLLGGAIFIFNALGYLGFAVAMSAPLALASRWRWLMRGALVLFALGSIGAWFMFGARYWLAYLDKAIEVALIGLLVLEMIRYDGGPISVVRRAEDLVRNALRRFGRRSVA